MFALLWFVFMEALVLSTLDRALFTRTRRMNCNTMQGIMATRLEESDTAATMEVTLVEMLASGYLNI